MGRSRLLPFGIFVILTIFLALGLRLDPRKVPSPLIGKPAPGFSLARVRDPGKTIDHKELRGKVSLFNVWASWCVSCRDEHPVLVAFARRSHVPVYGLNYKDERTDAIRWLNYFGDPYVASVYDRDGRVGIDWGVYGVPETFVVDQDGIIRHKHIGPLTDEVLEQEILPLVRKLEVRES